MLLSTSKSFCVVVIIRAAARYDCSIMIILASSSSMFTPLAEVCLLYPLSLPEIDHIVVGVDNVDQLSNIIEKSKSQQSQIDWSFMISEDQNLINPTNWNIL